MIYVLTAIERLIESTSSKLKGQQRNRKLLSLKEKKDIIKKNQIKNAKTACRNIELKPSKTQIAESGGAIGAIIAKINSLYHRTLS